MSTAPDRWAWSPLGQMLVNDKLLSTEQLNQALERQRKTRERLGQILIDMKLIDEDILLKYLGAQFRKDPITRQDLAALDPDVVKLVSEEVARQYGVIAAERSGRGRGRVSALARRSRPAAGRPPPGPARTCLPPRD